MQAWSATVGGRGQRAAVCQLGGRLAACLARYQGCGSEVSAAAVRRRQQWLFALVSGGSLVVAGALVWAWLNMTMLGALLNTVDINVTQAMLTLLVSLFGMASGLLWALPLMRVRRA